MRQQVIDRKFFYIQLMCWKVFNCRWIYRLSIFFSQEWGAILNKSLMFPYLLSTNPVATFCFCIWFNRYFGRCRKVGCGKFNFPSMNSEPCCIFASGTKYFGRYKKSRFHLSSFLNANNSTSCYCIIINILHCWTL